MTPDAARTLNDQCFCVGQDPQGLRHRLAGETGLAEAPLADSHPHLFAATAAFVSQSDIDRMMAAVQAIERIATLPLWRRLTDRHADSWPNDDTLGVFMGYDFHLGANGPRLIEINTNAGGAFLNALAAAERMMCCVRPGKAPADVFDAFVTDVAAMFEREWMLFGRPRPLHHIAIVDEAPEKQYLHPEFLLAKRMLEARGYRVTIADPSELAFDGDVLTLAGVPVDLVYNRLTDFTLHQPANAALRAAWQAGSVSVTPNPSHHARLADKALLTYLSDPSFLRSIGAAETDIAALDVVPKARLACTYDAADLWSARKGFFFKPKDGHAGKAVYRGDKLTRSVFEGMEPCGTIVQERCDPSTRAVNLDGTVLTRKMDVRLYTYAGALLLPAARLYDGQTTNFRTPGGGFAPVIVG